MEKKSRTKIIYINIIITLISQILQILLGFIIRKLFINTLGVHYLGYNSVFQNLLQMLNLADFGIGIAITSYLYTPLARDDMRTVSALMYMYKRIYQLMGLIVFILGIIMSLFLPILIPDAVCSAAYLRLFFYINLAGTVSTYFLAYKRTLLIADQKSYVIAIVDSAINLVFSIIQIGILLLAPSYSMYLLVTIAKNIIANIFLSSKSDKTYGKVGNKKDNLILNEYRPKVYQYVKDVFIARTGSFIYYSTDNIIISLFMGSIVTGYLSNYTLITTQVSNVINQILASVQATFGNYVSVNEDIDKQMKMADNYLCVNFCVGNFSMICIMFLIQPFIQLMFGREYILNFSTAVWLAINLMLTIMMQLPAQVFMIYKLYRYDRLIIIISAMSNIIISIALVNVIGINGVLIGTFITSLLYLFSRLYIISRHVYHIPYRHYVLKILRYGLVSIISVVLVYLMTKGITGISVMSFVIRMICVGISSVIIPSACLIVTREFDFLIQKLVPQRLRKFCSKYVVWCICVISVLIFMLLGE